MLGAITQFKLKKVSKKRMITQLLLWLCIAFGLALAQPIYKWLFDNHLTTTEPLSLFDVIQITGIVITFYIAYRARFKIDQLDKRLNDLHQEVSIIISKDAKN